MIYRDMGEHLDAHRPASRGRVLEQLKAVPVGRWGVAGLRGSGWDPKGRHALHPKGGRPRGPGVCVKRQGEDAYLVGCVRPLKTAEQTADYVIGLCRHNA